MRLLHLACKQLSKRHLTAFAFLLLPVFLFAQGKTITGTVRDETGKPVVGASVIVKNSTIGTSTDSAGKFSITVPGKAVLAFSSINYVAQEITVGDNTTLVITLPSANSTLSDVVVVGYGTQKKENLTGAVSTVNFSDRLGDRPVNTIGTVLQGAAPGLQVTRTTGEPGGGFSINIRGTTSINGGSPLILVDNVPFEGGLNLLDPSEIESMSILKDAASASIYGARSAYGVILITTKKGRRNTPGTINYSNNFTFNTAPFLPEKASPLATVQAYKDAGAVTYYSGQNVATWLDLLEQYNRNPSAFPSGFAMNNGTRYQLRQTNEMEDLLGHTGMQTNHNISVNGGGEHSIYRLSFGSTNDDGIVVTDKDKFKRYNIKGFVSTDIKPWLTTSLDMLYNNSVKTMPNVNNWFQTATAPSYNPTDTIVINGETFYSGTGANFVRLGSVNKSGLSDIRLSGKVTITPIKQIRLNTEYTFDKLNGLFDNYYKRIRYANSAKFGEEFSRSSSQYDKYSQTTDYKALNIYGDYTQDFGDHGLKLLAGFNQEERYFEQQYSSISQMINEDLPSLSQGIGEPKTNDTYDEYALQGFFGRINYNYRRRYLLEVNGRYDGSSKFPPNHRWGFFPSVSGGWRISEEAFMKRLKPYLSELKLRGSYGTVGNQAIGTYAFVPGMDSYRSTWLDNNAQPITLSAPGLVSNSFTWETVISKNIGVDFGFLKNRLTGSLDFYTRVTRNMLAPGEELPAVLGANAPLKNVADLKTKGFELEVNWNHRIGNVKYYLGINVYDNTAKITRFKNEGGLLSQNYVGQQIGEIWGYEFDRYYTKDDFVEGTLSPDMTNGKLKPGVPRIEGVNPNPGDILFRDLNGDNIINAGNSTLANPGDRKIIGKSSLRYQYGIRSGADFKGFSLSFNLNGVMKRDVYLNNDLTNAYNYEFGTIYKHQLNYWTPENTNPEYPRLYIAGSRITNHTSNYRTSTKTLLSGAYLRLQNITVGYTISNAWVKKIGIGGVRVFASGENLHTWSKLPKGIDPATSAISNGLGYPYMRSFSFGLNVNL
jgi:TonB-linked SusC/RagA family outer membrane protein